MVDQTSLQQKSVIILGPNMVLTRSTDYLYVRVAGSIEDSRYLINDVILVEPSGTVISAHVLPLIFDWLGLDRK